MNAYLALLHPVRPLSLGLIACLSCGLAAASEPAPVEVLIPYEKFSLDNGLTVIVHTDRKAPIRAPSSRSTATRWERKLPCSSAMDLPIALARSSTATKALVPVCRSA